MNADIVIQTLVSGLLVGCAYALASVGFTIVFGVMNVANFAHGHIIMLAMFGAYALATWAGISPYLAAPLLFGAFVLLGRELYRFAIGPIITSPVAAQLLTTLGIMIVLENLANLMFGGDLRSVPPPFGNASLRLGEVRLPWTQVIAGGASLLVIGALWLFLQHTRMGAQIRAAADNQVGAIVVGIPIQKVFGWAFGLATGTAALAAALLVPTYLVSPFVGHEFMLRAFVIAIIGGLGSFPGVLAAGLLIGVIESMSSLFIGASIASAMVFGLLLVTILIRPQGMFGRAA